MGFFVCRILVKFENEIYVNPNYNFSNYLPSQSLVFSNSEETIAFKKNELININGQKYRYLRPLKNRTKIHLLKSSFIKQENIQFDIGKIETFRKYKRFKISNALRMAYFGFGTATILEP